MMNSYTANDSKKYSVIKLFSTFFSLTLLFMSLMCSLSARAQQTLGGITGQVTDTTGAALPDAIVTIKGDSTGLTRTSKANAAGEYNIVNLPLGTYTITVTHDGFDTAKYPGILIQGDRTTTLNAPLKPGTVGTTIQVDAAPLLNTVDTTNGYVLDKDQIDAVPLPTGSFTGLAILSPGVNAELPGGTGVNSGLGNAPIWANGQRDTSNSFQLNGVDASNLFNGKSTSQVASARVVNNTGNGNGTGGGVIQSGSSIYLAIGNAIPTPAPETVEEVRVNASMYDAQQGSNSGAHIDLSTKSGSNLIHGELYGHRGTNWINAAPFFFKKDSNIPAAYKNPELHRYTAGGTLSGPIIKDKLFGFVAYQHLHVSDQETGDTELAVPPGLSSTNRTAQGLTNLVNANWSGGTSADWSNGNGIGLALFQAKLPNGNYLIPNDNGHVPDFYSPYNAFESGTSRFTSDQIVSDLDYNVSTKDLLALKYYYQHDPNSTPYAISSVPGFTEHMDVGSQVGSINNVQNINSNLSITETLGFLREKAYSTNDQLWSPGQSGTPVAGMTAAFGSYFPGITIVDALGASTPQGGGSVPLNIGPASGAQNAYTGVFQNRIMPSANAIWTKGRHSVTFGASWSFTQLNIRDRRTGKGTIASPDFSTFALSEVTPYSTNGFVDTTYLQGNANRYYRSNTTGAYVQDKFQVKPNLSITAGLRYDWDGGLTEKYGRIFNFNPSLYSYNAAGDNITNAGLVIAGNNVNGTSGTSNTTLTGRQWGMAPRVGFAWEPSKLHDKLVVRGGGGLYYDRGELFTYLSPGFAAGTISGGPFGVAQTLPFVSQQQCPFSSSPYSPLGTYLYEYYQPICGTGYNFATPYGSSPAAAPVNPKASSLIADLPNAAAIINGAEPYTLGAYNPTNKLPYSINYTLDIQWQPSKTILLDFGYVGNLGRHQVIPLPINQAKIATTSSPTLAGGPNAQYFSYGYTVYDNNTFEPECVNDPTEVNCQYGQMQQNFEGGNVDLRVPYLGYSSESESYTAAGVSDYNALQVHFEKRISHGIQAGASYTYSHTNDEQSALGLFYNGNNPNILRSGYGLADFDRKHVINFTYSYTTPKFLSEGTVSGKVLDSWSINGVAIIQSGQPYSIIDYSGAVGSIYYSTFDGITNPIVPLKSTCTAKSATTGANGAFYNPTTGKGAALNPNCFTIPLIAQGTNGVPNGDVFETGFTSGQRNIFRQSWQRRADASLVKDLPINARYDLRYTFDVYNMFNTSSFDIPSDNVSQNNGFNNAPFYVSSVADALPTGCGTTSAAAGALYACPGGLGVTKHTIGSPRQIQMSLRLTF